MTRPTQQQIDGLKAGFTTPDGSVPGGDVAALLSDYDAAVAECPITSSPHSRHYQVKDRDVCKRCLATPSQACGREVSASHRLIFSLRFILTEAGVNP